MKTHEGQLNAQGLRFAIIASRFNSFMTDQLIGGAVDTIVRHGGSSEQIELVKVPGSYELPIACRKVAESGRFDAIVAVGAIIRGATPHFDVVCSEASRGISSVSLSTGVPIGFGVITADSLEQAIERAGTKAGNKGAEAASAAIEMVNVMRSLSG